MAYPYIALFAVLIFSAVHLFAEKLRDISMSHGSRIYSTGSGVAIAYIFIDLLPKLSHTDAIVKDALWQFFPYFERHVYVMALAGFLLFFVVDRSEGLLGKGRAYFLLSLSSYSLFNFLVGYAVVDKTNPEVQPIILFTFAMALHYFMNDFTLSQAHGNLYNRIGRWILIASLFLGWFTGLWMEISPAGIGLVSAFIGGGVIMNVTRHELPAENPHSLTAFLVAAFAYTALLLGIGA